MTSLSQETTLPRDGDEQTGCATLAALFLRVGDFIDDYEIVGVLGNGGMGDVYRCVHPTHGEVAVKVLRSSLSSDPDLAHRFEREAQVARRIRSGRVVGVIEAGVLDDDAPYIVMNYLRGETLSDRLKRDGTLSPPALYPIIEQLLEGLEAAHEAGVVHRDLKPGNIFLTESDDDSPSVKLLDFGVSKFVGHGSFTGSGVLLGTPHYMAPEQAMGAKHADARSDIYSVGVIMFSALSGEKPHDGESFFDLIAQLLNEDPKQLLDIAPHVDHDLAAVVHKALQRDPDERFADARDFLHAIRALFDGRASLQPPPPLRVAPVSTVGAAIGHVVSAEQEIDAPTPVWLITRQQNTWLHVAAFAATFVLSIVVLSQLLPRRDKTPVAALLPMTTIATPALTLTAGEQNHVAVSSDDEVDTEGAADGNARPRVIRHRATPHAKPDRPTHRFEGDGRFNMSAQKPGLMRLARSGHANETDLRMLRAICMHDGDKPCRNYADGVLRGRKR